MAQITHIAGVDGCRDGWLCAVLDIGNGRVVDSRLDHAATFADVLALQPGASIIAIDMPIGLPAFSTGSGRPPERAVRKLLGPRQSSVFSIPARAAVMQDDYSAACTTALETSDPPRKVSKQAFHIFPKIREIDAVMTPDLQARIFECHPETTFMAVSGSPASLPKKIKSRINPDGLAWRRDCLVAQGIPETLLTSRLSRGVRHGADDIVDACACALTAWRILRGVARRFPDAIHRDERGLDMVIWA